MCFHKNDEIIIFITISNDVLITDQYKQNTDIVFTNIMQKDDYANFMEVATKFHYYSKLYF